MKLTDFQSKFLGKQVEFHSFGNTAFNQCVDLVNAYINYVLDCNTKDYTEIIGTNASDFVTKYDKEDFTYIANTPKGVPQNGDIIVWNNKVGGGAGHVAIVLEANVKTFKSLDQNWSKREVVTEETHNYTNVLGWLRPIVKELTACTCEDKNITTEVETTYNLKDIKRYNKHWTYGDLTKDWILLNEELENQKDYFDKEFEEVKKKIRSDVESEYQTIITDKNNYIVQLEARVQELEAYSKGTLQTAKDLINKLKGLFNL